MDTNNNLPNTEKTAEKAVNNLSNKVDKISDVAHQTVEKTATKARQAISASADQMVHLKNKAVDGYHYCSDSLEHRVTQKPFQSVLIAAGIGAVIGCLWSNSHRDKY